MTFDTLFAIYATNRSTGGR